MKQFTHRFIIPGFFHLPEYDLSFLSQKQYPNLERFFASVECVESSENNLDDVLQGLSSLQKGVAPLVNYYTQAPNALIASPINLRADINSTWIQPAIFSYRIDTIMKDLADYFADDLILLEEVDGHFIIQFKKTKVVDDFPHYLSVLGKKIDAYQQAIREHIDWFKLVNEIQMYLHGHELNQTKSGQQLFNSLWFWGGNSSQSITFEESIQCDDPLMQSVFTHCSQQSNHQVSIQLKLLKYLKLNSNFDLEEFFNYLDLEFSKSNHKNICLETADGYRYIYNPWQKFKFWQTSKPLKDIIIQIGNR